MSAHIDEALDELRALLNDAREQAEEQVYGTCFVDDPRDFSPDAEVCTPEEIERHRDDCARAERGEPRETQTRCYSDTVKHEGRDCAAIVTPSGYGQGVNTVRDERAAEYAERLERAIGMIEVWLGERGR